MADYYDDKDLVRFSEVSKHQKEMGTKFFNYYGSVFQDDELTSKEKTLIALAVSHAVQCPYCIDSFTTDAYEKGFSLPQMMEAVHVATAIRGGSALVHGVQMMKKVEKISM